MLAKKNRLNLAAENNASIFIRGNSKVLSSDFFLAYVRENEQNLLCSCLVPKSVFTKASKRNFYRRLLYSFLEQAVSIKPSLSSLKLDLVIILKKKFSEDKDELKKDFSTLLEKIENA